MNFRQEDLPAERIFSSISSLIEKGDFRADTLVVDGFDLSRAESGDVERFSSFAEKADFSVWLSASTAVSPGTGAGIPAVLKPHLDHIDVVVGLEPYDGHVRLRLLKDHDSTYVSDMHLALDSHILSLSITRWCSQLSEKHHYQQG